MKTKFFLLIGSSLLLWTTAAAQIDRSTMPAPGTAPEIAFPQYELQQTSNGIRVVVVENHKLPTVSMRLLIDRKPIQEGDLMGYVSITGQLLRTGTATRTKDQIDEEIDMLGGNLGSAGTAVFASGLSRHTEKLLELMADITLNPTFPQEELDKIVTQTTSALKARKTSPDAITGVVRKRVLYGKDHPYGEVETEETVGAITRQSCMDLYRSYFKPDHAILAVVGDIEKEEILRLLEKYFGGWERGPIPSASHADPAGLDSTLVAFVDRSASVQSVIRVTHTLKLPRTSPDVIPVSVMGTVLGGGSSFRLFVNLREEHAYTYGAYCSIGPDELIGNFTVQTSVRNQVTDSALTEIFYEIRRIRNKPVADEELQRAKNYIAGAFVRSLENPGTVASYAIDIERYGLPEDYYRNYLKNLEKVTAQDVQRVARTYLTPERAAIVVVGKGSEVRAGLEPFGEVKLYDEIGELVVQTAAPDVAPEEILSGYVSRVGGREKIEALKDRTMELSGTMRQFTVKIKSVQKAPAKSYMEFEIVGMMKQRSGFDGTAGWAETPQGIIDLQGEQLEQAKADAPINFYDHYTSMGYNVAVTGMKTVNGKECYEVTFSGQSKPELRHYFDVGEFLKRREVQVIMTPAGSSEQTTDLLDYREIQGIHVPTRFEQTIMGQLLETRLDTMYVNTSVADELFKKPAK
jgi:predicted Zn-dependent peptidase